MAYNNPKASDCSKELFIRLCGRSQKLFRRNELDRLLVNGAESALNELEYMGILSKSISI